jgi:hypothetical protein
VKPSIAASSIAIALIVAITLYVLTPFAVIAQGCAACYQSAAASGPRMIEALRHGIYLLMLAPTLICAGIAYLAYRRRDLHKAE